MHVLLFTRVVFIISILMARSGGEKPQNTDNSDMCRVFSKDPYFEPELVVGKPWRIYFSWNVNVGPKCLDFIFRNATKEIVQRFWTDMNEYLEYQPNWNAAALVLTLRSPQYEVLLFADQGPAGSFIGVPNAVRDGNPLPKLVSLNKFHMKLVRNGKYLVVMDCKMGAVTMSARVRKIPPSLVDVAPAAAELGLGEGHPACTLAKTASDRFRP